jgi:thioredoxin-like negative regulator of GroEL
LDKGLLQVPEIDGRPPLGELRLERRLLQEPERYWRPPLAQVARAEVEAALDGEDPSEAEEEAPTFL